MLIMLSLLLAAVTCAKAVMFSNRKTHIGDEIRKAIEAADVNIDVIKQFQANYSNAAEKLKNKSLFSAPGKEKVNPVKRVDAIMGSSARINDKWYEVGDTIGEAKLVSVNFADVTILWDGKETKFSPISAPTTYAVQNNPQPVMNEKPVNTKPAVENGKGEQIKEQPVAQTMQDDPLAWAGVTMSPELRAKVLERWNKMSDKEKAEAKKGWEKMTPDQRQKMVDRMEMMKDQM